MYAPSCGRFACGYEPAWLPQAQADSGGCPDDIVGAAADADWAANRITSIADQKLTAGLYFDADGMVHRFDSRKGADADTALKVGREVGVFPASGRPNVVDHVEVKVAAAMREAGELAGVLLPVGATLTVWWPDPAGGSPRTQTFVGDRP